jgi:hypothetical protein
MFLDPFHDDDAGSLRVSAAQGSAFAKDVAGDFNPIHDAHNPRFCVPGDLLFALVLARHGLSSRMDFRFTGMVGADTPIVIDDSGEPLQVRDGAGKTCLTVARGGEATHAPETVESLVRRYVAFSGHNFPHFLVPLMERHGVMINTERPLVIYERMVFDLSRLDLPLDGIALTDSTLEVAGRRGDVRLRFSLSGGDTVIGEGAKTLVLSGLRPLERTALDGLVARYAGWAQAHRGRAATGAGS